MNKINQKISSVIKRIKSTVKRNKKDINEIGHKCYDFDFEQEKTIYCYLCCIHVKNKNIRKLSDELKFDMYQQWKDYVYNKYKDYKSSRLIEFSRYLNNRIRNISPCKEYLNIIFSCYITVAFTIICDRFLQFYLSTTEVHNTSHNIISIVVTVVAFVGFYNIIKVPCIPIIDNNIEENLFRDYKEIIDEIISVKED